MSSLAVSHRIDVSHIEGNFESHKSQHNTAANVITVHHTTFLQLQNLICEVRTAIHLSWRQLLLPPLALSSSRVLLASRVPGPPARLEGGGQRRRAALSPGARLSLLDVLVLVIFLNPPPRR